MWQILRIFVAFAWGVLFPEALLKVAIKINGQRPTFAKCFHQWLETELPQGDLPVVMENLPQNSDAQMTVDRRAKAVTLYDLTRNVLK